MSRFRSMVCALFCLALAHCGGGGGGTGGGGGGGGGTTPPPGGSEGTRQILQDCLPAAFDAFLLEIALYLDAIGGQGVAAGLDIDVGTVESMPGFRASWMQDRNADMAPDSLGFFVTEDAGGMPTAPFADVELDPLRMNGTPELKPLLDTLDGHVLAMSSLTAGDPSADGGVRAPYAGGAAGALSASYTLTGGTCSTVVSMSDVPQANFSGAFPSGSFSVAVTQGTDVLTGVLATSGVASATATISHNGGANASFLVDLGTGTVSIAP